MAEEDQQGTYALVKENGEQTNSSREYTGKGIATYPNGEIYEGMFDNGVDFNKFRLGKVRESTLSQMVMFLLENIKTI